MVGEIEQASGKQNNHTARNQAPGKRQAIRCEQAKS